MVKELETKSRAIVFLEEKDPSKTNLIIFCEPLIGEDGTAFPSFFNANTLTEKEIINNISGKEGELILSYLEGDSAKINENGELIISSENDITEKYGVVKKEGTLTYGINKNAN